MQTKLWKLDKCGQLCVYCAAAQLSFYITDVAIADVHQRKSLLRFPLLLLIGPSGYSGKHKPPTVLLHLSSSPLMCSMKMQPEQPNHNRPAALAVWPWSPDTQQTCWKDQVWLALSRNSKCRTDVKIYLSMLYLTSNYRLLQCAVLF